jgi:hypothetical protein
MKIFFDLLTIIFILLVMGVFLGFDGFLGILLMVTVVAAIFYVAFWLLIFGGLVAIAKHIMGEPPKND